MRKVIFILIFLLLAGLYIDARNVGRDCNARYYQPMFVIQTIVPFRAERETLFFGYGEKINNYPIHPDMYRESYIGDGEIKYGWSTRTKCVVYTKDGKPWDGDHFYYIDLKFWEAAK